MSHSALLTRDEAPAREPVWQPMSCAPLAGLILLKAPIEGGHWPVVGKFSSTHGGFCSLSILGQTEQKLYPVAWCAIPAYDTDFHAHV